MHYECNKINLNCCGSYIGSLDWIKNKKATMNPKNNDDNYFQYAVTVALNQIKYCKKPVKNIKDQTFYK